MEINSFRWDIETVEHIANHLVNPDEVEDVAFDDEPHIRKGRHGRRYLYGQTIGGRYLFIVYVLNTRKEAKVITARDMDEKEKRLYLKRGK
jgi:uncharacterized DUF497 family protein